MIWKYHAFAATICGVHSDKSSSCSVPQGGWDLAFLSRCLECIGKSCSQGFLTKAFLSFREHHTNISKIHDGECKQDMGPVSAIEVKNPSLRTVSRILIIPQISLANCKRTIWQGLRGSQSILCFYAQCGWVLHPPCSKERVTPRVPHQTDDGERG